MIQRIDIRDQPIDLLPEKLVYLPQQNSLLVADTHFGKAATFRHAGIPVPAGTSATMLSTLTNVIQKTSAERLIFLGDFVHSSTRTRIDFVDDLVAWRAQHAALQLVLVPGNHDLGYRKIAAELQMEVQPEPFNEGSFSFCHFHEAGAESFTFAGHVHPAVAISESARSSLRVPCFAIANDHMLLPAFGEFTGCHVIQQNDYQQVIAVADSRLIKITRNQQQNR